MNEEGLREGEDRTVQVPAGSVTLEGALVIPSQARGIVMFAHVSGSSRHSPRNRAVAASLRAADLGTLLLDLLTPDEEQADLRTRHHRFDIDLLASRLAGAADWLAGQDATRGLPVGLFGASTGGGAALVAAALRPDLIRSVVSRGGRPDLAGPALERVQAPTLLIVGGEDRVVIDLNRSALEQLTSVQELVLVPGATHLFEEPGALEEVSRLAAAWFVKHLEA